ncbi:hypothetical protein [Flavitalea sp.]|nr:hypothetical protein [Flavitalea sp.]
MDKVNTNGSSAILAQFETPFADVQVTKEEPVMGETVDSFFSNYFKESESPFSKTYEAASSTLINPAGEDYVDLLAELEDAEFNEALYEIANEVEDTWRSKVSNETAMGDNFIPFAYQQAREYFIPVIRETENMIDSVSNHFSGNNLGDQSEASVESFFETLEFTHTGYTPAQEQLFGKIFDKVKSVVKKGVDLAKKGVAAVGKLMPLNIVLNKIKGLIKPLLDKVLKFAIGKLPKALQPHAQTLAKKFLNLETDETTSADLPAQSELEDVQSEFDNHIAQLLFAPEESEANAMVMNYEYSDETAERTSGYETGYVNTPSLDAARQQFIHELKSLPPGESPAPAIEKFLPVAIMALQPVIKIALKLIGRQRVINFLAGLLAKLVGKYVPANVAKPLAASIIDVGMSAIGFETYEHGNTDLAYEAIANTIEQTVQKMTSLDEAAFADSENLTMQTLEAFEEAAANNFPSQYIREELRPSKEKAVWVAMPRDTPAKFYKKFTHIYDINIDAQTANTVTTFRSLPLANFLRDKYGLDTSKPIKAKVHLYEITRGRLSMIARFEKLPGLNAKQPKAWIQLLPLTTQAASLLLKEPALGKDVEAKTVSTRLKTSPGQRFYYLEIEGARLRIPPVNRAKHKHKDNEHPNTKIESRSADIQGVINFVKSEIRLNYYFSEEDAKALVEKLNKNDFLGGAIAIRQSIKHVLNGILIKNISTKVKLVHESIPELYLENYSDATEHFSPAALIGKIAGKQVISKLVEKIIEKIAGSAYDSVAAFFKARATEFKEAQAQPQDGVTIKLGWKNVTGMSTIRTVIGAIRGNLSIGNLGNITMPSLQAPEIKVVADKRFD